MEKILIYGDSNVWGDNFITRKRIEDNKQWANILKEKYINKYQIIQEGLPGRIAGCEEQEKKYKNGMSSFISSFMSNAPLDKIIIALGTNDLQIKYNKTSNKIVEDLLWYKKQVEKIYQNIEDRKKYFKNKMPEFIYILPINFDYKDKASIIFNKESELKRLEVIKKMTNIKNIKILYSSNLSLFEDGIHLSYKGHEEMANLLEHFL